MYYGKNWQIENGLENRIKEGRKQKVRIGICDDEKEIREELKAKIRARLGEQSVGRNADQVFGCYRTVEIISYETGEALLADENVPDILFLDIQMPGKNGMETAGELRRKKKGMLLIFITALEEYVFQAFDVGAFHYLVKPFLDEKFYEVLDKAVTEYEENRQADQKNADRESRYIVVKTRGSRTKVILDTILYAEVFNRKIVLYTTEDEVEYYGKMAELQKRLGEDFYRTHRGYLVNLKYVKKYDASSVILENGVQVIMSKQQFPSFVKAYLRYNKRDGREA